MSEEKPKLNKRKLSLIVGLFLLLGVGLCGGVAAYQNIVGRAAVEVNEAQSNPFPLYPGAKALPDQGTDYFAAPMTYEVQAPVTKVAAWYREQLRGYETIADEVDPISGGELQVTDGSIQIALKFSLSSQEASQFIVFMSRQDETEVSAPTEGDPALAFIYHPEAIKISEGGIYDGPIEYRIKGGIDTVRQWHYDTLLANGFTPRQEEDNFLVFNDRNQMIEVLLWDGCRKGSQRRQISAFRP